MWLFANGRHRRGHWKNVLCRIYNTTFFQAHIIRYFILGYIIRYIGRLHDKYFILGYTKRYIFHDKILIQVWMIIYFISGYNIRSFIELRLQDKILYLRFYHIYILYHMIRFFIKGYMMKKSMLGYMMRYFIQTYSLRYFTLFYIKRFFYHCYMIIYLISGWIYFIQNITG